MKADDIHELIPDNSDTHSLPSCDCKESAYSL